MRRTVAAFVIASTMLLLMPAGALAHVGPLRTEVEATRDTPGTGTDVALAEGTWSADVLEVDGKPGQAFMGISVDSDGDGDIDEVAGIGGHPVVGGVLRSNQIVPAGIARLRLLVWGGSGPIRVKVAVNHP